MLDERLLSRRIRTASLTLMLVVGAGACAATPAARFLPPSQPAQFSMVGIPWNIARDSVTALIEPRGYNYNSTDDDGDMWFDGVALNTPTRLFAFMAGDTLVKLRMRLITADEKAFPTYARARAELVKLYGQPRESTEEYDAPFVKGQNEQEAVKAGKATINAHWTVGSGRRQSHVAIHMLQDLVVVVDYDGPAWNKEYLRRARGN
jgi:hypothetical protein